MCSLYLFEKFEILLYFFFIFCRITSALAWRKKIIFSLASKQLLQQNIVTTTHYRNYPLHDIYSIVHHIFIKVDITAWKVLFRFLVMILWIRYHYLLCENRKIGPRGGSTACQKQSYLYIICTLNPQFLILKVLPFSSHQAAYLIHAWNCDYQLYVISTKRMIVNRIHVTITLYSHFDSTSNFGISEEVSPLAVFRNITYVNFQWSYLCRERVIDKIGMWTAF